MNKSLSEIFEKQGQHQALLRGTTALQRMDKLRRFKSCLEKFEPAILKALREDLYKSSFEASVTELYYLYGEIDFALKHLSSWMKPKAVSKVFSNLFSSNKVYYEAKGRVLIISPWNYPLQLAFSPLISAISAGNSVILKPSELSPKTALVIDEIVKDCFAPEEVACFLGGVEISQELLSFPFNHIFFTGSTEVGKVVMEAAAKNLTSVTLELGGKSPAIISEGVELEKIAKKIAWGKLVNVGQTCIAPDYVLLPERDLDQFIGFYKIAVQALYPNLPHNPDYGKIINFKHFERLKNLVEEAVDAGARIALGGDMDITKRYIHPILITHLPTNCLLNKSEIFGPVLPILTYKTPEEALNIVLNKPKPLSLYIFSNNNSTTQFYLKQISAGGVCINDVLVHFTNPNLPFGGVNHSGIGSSHGFYGFKTFSHEKAVVFQSKVSFNSLVYPPFSNKQWVLKLLKKIM
ncbi:MAG: aldehyde dehydrogenase family protein [Pedobacter sp.]|nr:MAG: aldehyde dehydrogenase family protein [Pedobacter sp.]